MRERGLTPETEESWRSALTARYASLTSGPPSETRSWPTAFQTFSVSGQVLTAAQMNQVECINIRDKTSYTTAITLSAAAINETRSNIAQHATTMNFWAAGIGNVLDGTGSAVTLTAVRHRPPGGASRKFYPLAGTIIPSMAGLSTLTAI